MSEINWFGYWATFFLVVGTWFSIGKDSKGWILRMFGSLIWAYIGLRIHMSSLWVCELVFACMAFVGYKEWAKQECTNEESQNSPEYNGFPFTYNKPMWEDPDICINEAGDIKSGWKIIYTKPIKELKRGKNKNVKRKTKRKKVATRNRKTNNRKVSTRRGRRSK